MSRDSANVQKNDMDKYLYEQCEELVDDSFEILRWWKVNALRYKVLSQITRDVLAVSVSTVASESSFSTSRCILDPFKSSLAPRMVEALICLKNWLNTKDEEYEPVVLRQYMDEVESFADCYHVILDDGEVVSTPTCSKDGSAQVNDVESSKRPK